MMIAQAYLRMGMVGSYVRLRSQSTSFGAENIRDDDLHCGWRRIV